MERLNRRTNRPAVSPTTESSGPASAGEAGGLVQVIWGADSRSLDLASTTVGEAFQLLRAPLRIAAGARPLVNGDAVDADHQLGVGDTLEFARAAGEKGG